MTFLTINNGVITGLHDGDIEADFYGTPYYGHERVQVPDDTLAAAGESVAFYDKKWKRIPDVDLIKAGKMKKPDGHKIEKGKLIEMSIEERIEEGTAEIPKGMKILKGKLVEMTAKEKHEAGIFSDEQYSSIMEFQSTSELNRRLDKYMSIESQAMMLTDEEYAENAKKKIQELLDVRKQEGWPVSVTWPKEDGDA